MELHVIFDDETDNISILTEEYDRGEDGILGMATRKVYQVDRGEGWEVGELTRFLQDILLNEPDKWAKDGQLYVLEGGGRESEDPIYDLYLSQLNIG